MPTLRKQLTKEIRANHDAFKVARSFSEAYRNYCERDLVCLRRHFLCAAIKYGHTTLLTLLLSKPKFESFLQVGSPVTFKEIASENASSKVDEISLIEYACTFDRPEILKILVLYDKDETPLRPTPLHYACLHGAYKCIDYLLSAGVSPYDLNAFGSFPNYQWFTPLMLGVRHGLRMVTILLAVGASAAPKSLGSGSVLHIAVKLIGQWYDKEQLAELPIIIELLLNSGGCVEQRDEKNDTALNILLNQVNEERCSDVLGLVATKYRSAVVEIARLLLIAGSPTDSKPLEHLLNLMRNPKSSRLLDLPYVLMRRSLHMLTAQVFDVVLQNQTDRLLTYANECYYEILINSVAKLVEKLGPVLESSSDLNNLYNVIIDCHSELFRCLMVAGASDSISQTAGRIVFSDKFLKSEAFLNDFVIIAGYSTEEGRSLTFIRKILDAMSASQVDMLLRTFSMRKLLMTDSTPDDIRNLTDTAVEWLHGVEAPPSLKHLARRAITRAFPNEVLHGISTLKLPKILEQYLLLCY